MYRYKNAFCAWLPIAYMKAKEQTSTIEPIINTVAAFSLPRRFSSTYPVRQSMTAARKIPAAETIGSHFSEVHATQGHARSNRVVNSIQHETTIIADRLGCLIGANRDIAEDEERIVPRRSSSQ